MSALLRIVLASTLLASTPFASPQLEDDQFARPDPAHLPYPETVTKTNSTLAPLAQAPVGSHSNTQGELINFETQLIKPIVFTHNGKVAVANEPNGTLEIFSADLQLERYLVLGHGISSIAERVIPAEGNNPESGELWVTVRHQQAIAVISTSDWQLTHWLRAPIPENQVGYGAADHPGQVVISPDGKKAYTTSFHTNNLVVFDAVNKTFMSTVPLEAMHNELMTRMNTPYSLAADDDFLYVVSHISGNGTLARNYVLGDGGEPGPYRTPDSSVTIVNASDVGLVYPDFDVLKVNMSNDKVVGHFTQVGTTNFNILSNSQNGTLWVTGTDARNGNFIGEGSWAGGRVVNNRITIIDTGASPDDSHQIIKTDDFAAGLGLSPIAQPTDLVMDSRRRVWVAGYGSNNLGVFGESGAATGTLPTDSGPRGLAISPDDKLYVLSRGFNRILRYDVSSAVFEDIPTQPELQVDLTDPTSEPVKAGRRHFFTAENSGDGTASCASCHVDGRKDGLGWDLSAYHDEGVGFEKDAPPTYWKDLKGAMVTQDMRGLPEIGPFHWRGEQEDLKAFNGAFGELLHGTPLNNQEFDQFQKYVFSLVYPANFQQNLNRTSSDSADAFISGPDIGDADGGTHSCFKCHFPPYGTNNDLPFLAGPPHTTGSNQELVPRAAQLRGVVFKESPVADVDPGAASRPEPSTGFGLMHATHDIAGLDTNIQNFVTGFFSVFIDGSVFDPVATQSIVDFVEEFDTGVAPAAHYSELLNTETYASNRIGFMIDQANRKNCDLAGRGHLSIAGIVDQEVGLFWDRGTNRFVFDDSAIGPQSESVVRALINNGNLEVLLFGTPLHAGMRLGVDLDRDGVYDMTEVRTGLDPLNPDTDGDGLWDGYDPNPLTPSSAPTGGVVAFNVEVEVVTTSTIKVTWETSDLSPTAMLYSEAQAGSPGQYVGDAYPVSLSPNVSKVWKRHHYAFMQVLRAGLQHEFKILTQGQNGVFGQTQTYYVKTDADNLEGERPRIEVDLMTISSEAHEGGNRWTATALLTDADGAPLPKKEVSGYFMHYVNGVPTHREAVGPVRTNSAGYATLTTTYAGQSTGDRTEFVLPFALYDAETDAWKSPIRSLGVPAIATEPEFAWPDSGASSVTGFVN